MIHQFGGARAWHALPPVSTAIVFQVIVLSETKIAGQKMATLWCLLLLGEVLHLSVATSLHPLQSWQQVHGFQNPV